MINLMKTVLTVTCLLIVGLVAGCSSSAKPPAVTASAAAAVSTSPVVVVTASPTVWTQTEAGQQYLAMIAPGNADTNAIKALPNSAPLSQYTALAAKAATDYVTLDQALIGGRWPATVQGQITALETSVLQERAVLAQMSKATSTADYGSTLTSQESVFTTGSAASEAVRIALGLPAN